MSGTRRMQGAQTPRLNGRSECFKTWLFIKQMGEISGSREGGNRIQIYSREQVKVLSPMRSHLNHKTGQLVAWETVVV